MKIVDHFHFLDEMDRDRSWYCHQCSANVQITEQYTCQRCDSGFIEELPPQPRRLIIIEFLKVKIIYCFRQPTATRTVPRQAANGANLTIFDILQQFLTPPENTPLRNAQTQNR